MALSGLGVKNQTILDGVGHALAHEGVVALDAGVAEAVFGVAQAEWIGFFDRDALSLDQIRAVAQHALGFARPRAKGAELIFVGTCSDDA